MAENTFEGEITKLSEQQREFINNAFVKLGFVNSKISFQRVGKAGDNYAASVKRITVENGKDHENFTMVAKIAPAFDNPQLSENTSIGFKNEHLMYTEVLPKLVQHQKDAGIPEEEQLRFAKCYGSLSVPSQEVILLEDLKISGFEMLDRFKPLSNECVKSVLKNFALLHSLSYVLRHKEPETYENFKANLSDVWSVISEDKVMTTFFQGLDDETVAILEDPEHKNFVRNKIKNAVSLMTKLTKSKYDSKYTVIHQGDPWTNNIMFKFEGDKLASSVMIDYQLSSNTSPVCDILYMIFSCTDYNSRKQHYYDWIDYYHSELDKSLSNFKLKAIDVYPREVLDTELKEYGKYQFGQAAFLASTAVKKSSEAEKMMEGIKTSYDNDTAGMEKSMGVLTLDEESRALYKIKITGLIKSFTELGLA